MIWLRVFVAVLFSVVATVVMSYIAMATAIGPWIETTLVLAGMLIFYLFRSWYTRQGMIEALALTTVAGGIGGIVATACGFTFPTLYFLDYPAFCSLMSNPLKCVQLVGSLVIAAGSCGLFMAQLFEHQLLVEQELPFPIGELVYKLIMAIDNMYKALMLGIGFISTQCFLIVRSIVPVLAQPLVVPGYSWGALQLPRVTFHTDLVPLFWAVGFVTGQVIAIPLLLGVLANILCIQPLHYVYPVLYAKLFSTTTTVSFKDFQIAFCSGMVVYGAAWGFLSLPRVVGTSFKELSQASSY